MIRALTAEYQCDRLGASPKVLHALYFLCHDVMLADIVSTVQVTRTQASYEYNEMRRRTLPQACRSITIDALTRP